jgi:hypothetical protein
MKTAFGSTMTHTITIDADPETIWSVYTDVAHWPDWTASVTSSIVEPSGPLAAGTRAVIKQPKFPRVAWTVTEIEANRWWKWVNHAPGAHTEAGHQLTPLGDGRTRVDTWIDQRGVLGRPIGWIARRTTRRYLRMEAEGLQRAVETPTATQRHAT